MALSTRMQAWVDSGRGLVAELEQLGSRASNGPMDTQALHLAQRAVDGAAQAAMLLAGPSQATRQRSNPPCGAQPAGLRPPPDGRTRRAVASAPSKVEIARVVEELNSRNCTVRCVFSADSMSCTDLRGTEATFVHDETSCRAAMETLGDCCLRTVTMQASFYFHTPSVELLRRLGDFPRLRRLEFTGPFLWDRLTQGMQAYARRLQEFSLHSDAHDGGAQVLPMLNLVSQVAALNLSRCDLRLTDGMFSRFANLVTLDVSQNDVRRLEPGVFHGLPGLQGLYCGLNAQLLSLPEDAFDGLSALRTLWLTFNSLTAISARWLADKPNLTHFAVEGNNITELPPGVFDAAPALEVLLLHTNSLPLLPEGVFDALGRLSELNLNRNRITALPEGIFSKLVRLRVLALAQNKLADLPEAAFSQQTSLQVLSLYRNIIGSLPPRVFRGLTQLNVLYLEYNPLAALPEGLFDDLASLSMVNIGYNTRLTSLPAGLFHATPHLAWLNMERTGLPALPRGLFDGLGGLKTLRMSHNDLGALQQTDVSLLLAPLTRLSWLEMASCGLAGDLWDMLPGNGSQVMTGLNVSDNPALTMQYGYWPRLPHLTLIDISSTHIPIDTGMCRPNVTLVARDLINATADVMAAVIGSCLEVAKVIDLSHNDALSNVSLLQRAVDGFNSVIPTTPRDASGGNRLATLQMESSNAGCNLQRFNPVRPVPPDLIDNRELTEAFPQFAPLPSLRLVCQCGPSYRAGDDGVCRAIPPFWSPGRVVAVTLGCLLALGAALALAVRSVRRRRWLSQSLHLHQGLLEETKDELLVLKVSHCFFTPRGGGQPRPHWHSQCAVQPCWPPLLLASFPVRLCFHSITLELTQLPPGSSATFPQRAWEIEPDEVELHELIGEGSFGQVWRGRWSGLDIAVKILRQNVLEVGGEFVQAEFEREIEFMQRTRHPNIVRFFGTGRGGKVASGRRNPEGQFLVEELMPRGSLKQLLSQQRELASVPVAERVELTWPLKRQLVLDVAAGMAHIHSLGHLHRDLKPGNVLVTTDLRAKVADFGSVAKLIRKVLDSDRDMGSTSGGRASSAVGNMTIGVGTPAYMSVEALTSGDYNQATDVWSFGVLLWEVASGEQPDLARQQGLRVGHPLGVLADELEAGARLKMDAGWPPVWQELTSACWHGDPSARPTFPMIASAFAST